MGRYYEEKKEKYCCDDCCKRRCYCDCTKTKEAVIDANFHAGKARLGIETVFQYEDPCDNLEVLCQFFKDADENIHKLICALKYLSKYFEKECYYCGYDAAYIIQRAIRDAEVADIHWHALYELIDECNCECVLCEALVLVTVAFERIARAEILVASLKKLLKEDKEDKCKEDKC